MAMRQKEKKYHQLYTEAGERLTKEKEQVWQEHPRPQMKRENWTSLNGEWELDGEKILVPFSPQSVLSGYDRKVKKEFVYEKRFELPENLRGERLLLHFDGVDQIAEVVLNGQPLGSHEGGYLDFSFDVTEAIAEEGENILLVKATDRLDQTYPYGKQRKKRGGMWYTPFSGIWKSVWMEAVPEHYIEAVKMTPDLTGVFLELTGEIEGFSVEAVLENGQKIVRNFEGKSGRLELSGILLENGETYEPKLWTPEEPHLYPMTVTAGKDRVETYFALRTIEIQKIDGISRVCLNKEPVFLHGVLDQGYFPDGLVLPAEESEYERDILRMKELGFNLLRKHIKIEPEYFYYACDRLGMLVMQDMVNSGPYHFIRETALPTIGFKKRRDPKGIRGKRKRFFEAHMEETVCRLYNHPSLIAYTIFNEGWGQFESDRFYDRVKELDPGRLVDATSGWFAQKKSDFDSEHIYFKAVPVTPKERPMLLSECGGYSLVTEGHRYNKDKVYGYGACEDSQKLTEEILHLYDVMILPAVQGGMCGCIYTQLSDVEDEVNGLYTYDRKVCKVEKEKMRELAEKLRRSVK